MSYILDALRRADAERDRGAVPDLNAQHLVLGAQDDAQPVRAQRPWGWLAAGGAIALVGVGLWKYGADEPAVVVAVPPRPAPMSTATPAPTPTTSPPPLPTAALPGPAAAAAPAAPTPAAPAVKPPTSAAVKAPATAAAKPPPAKLPTLAELPDGVRRELPALNVGGSVYSEQAAARMVIVNGQVFREGDALAPGLLLERITPKSAIFAIRGQRFELRF